MDSANRSLIENETYGAKIQGSGKNIWGTIYYYSSHEVEKQSEWVQLVTSTSTNIFPNLKGQMDVILDYKKVHVLVFFIWNWRSFKDLLLSNEKDTHHEANVGIIHNITV